MRRLLTIKLCVLFVCMLLTTVTASAGPKLFRVFYSFDASNGLADNSAQTIKCTKTGRMVISTIGHINFYDGDSFTHIDPRSDDLFPLPKYNGHYHIYFDRFHHLWLKDKKTVTCLDLMQEQFVSDVDSVFKSLGVKRQVDDLFGDVNSHLWILSGNQLYGVNAKKTIPVRSKAELQDVDVYDNKTLLQFFSNGVVSAYNIETGRHEYDAAAFETAEDNHYAASSVIYPDSNVYYQIRNGEKDAVLLRFDVNTRQWETLLKTPYHLNNMTMFRGRLYIASEYGYWSYSPETKIADHVEELILTKGRRLSTDINDICFDRQGGMWLGTEKRGLLYSRPFKIPFVSYSWDTPEAKEYARLMDQLPPSAPLPRHVNCKYRDSRGWLWTGTYTGLELQRPGSSQKKVFTHQDGMLNEMVRSVIEDNNHDMWIATSFGISHLYIQNDSVHKIETYTHADNVPGESFVNGRAMKLDDGTIVMQSLDHVLAFHPSNFYEREIAGYHLYPKLVRLLVNGHLVKAGTRLDGRRIVDRAVTRAREITVNYNQNSLSLTFSGLNYMRPSQTYYRVRVTGVYNEWRILSYSSTSGLVDKRGMLHLPLTGLNPGKYLIELQASMDPDNWPVEPLTWVVNVQQPWWRSTGIYLLLGLIIIICLLANVVYFYRNTRLKFQLNHPEDDLLRRIKNFADRSDSMTGEVLAPVTSGIDENEDKIGDSGKVFENAMLVIVPYLRQHPNELVRMHQLAAMAHIEEEKLIEVLSANLYKSPRKLALSLRLQQAAQMLLESDRDIGDIAHELKFVTPNYFIASFYHQYRQTPEAYRKINAR